MTRHPTLMAPVPLAASVWLALTVLTTGACLGENAPAGSASSDAGRDTSAGANGDAALMDSMTADTAMLDDTAAAPDTMSTTDGIAPAPDDCPPANIEIIPGDPLVIPTREGPVVGVLADNVRSWLGVPFAAPPVGARRFSAPAQAACRQSPLVASRFGPACPQMGDDGSLVGAEDCLTLNVWAPAPTADDPGPWPVLVFIHGGGNIQGSASETLPGGGAIYDGQFLARAGRVVVVTIQYRLGALGWLTHPALDGGREGDASTNRGLLDQQLSLRWFNNHAENFGGDRERLVIFGESAGAVNVGLHLVAPGSQGLFSRAIIQSGTPRGANLVDARAAGVELVNAGPCGEADDVRDCLEGLSTAEILAAMPGKLRIGDPSTGGGVSNFGPVIGDDVLPTPPLEALRTRRTMGIAGPEVIVGSNADEMANLMTLQVDSLIALEAAIKLNLGIPLAITSGLDSASVTTRILATYGPTAYASPQEALVDIYTDLRFTCPAVELLEALDGPAARNWRYLFSRRVETRNGPQPASHGRELVYVFGTWRHIPLYRPADADIALSDTMLGTWAAFAANGRPLVRGHGGTDATVTWPTWTEADGDTLVFDEKTRVEKAPREDRCTMWRNLLVPTTR